MTNIQKLIDQGYEWVVYAAYEHAGHEKGEIISKHKSYAAAEKKARNNNFLGIRDINEYLDR